ncbi:hypothetical protein [Streptomyces longhuiensis]|uniref:hypothetical protein n=1 Tax=Streptomyces longhuiensis TaxID=2880933 RepID=UPI001D0A7FCD|nr:hypothetical protein [Streptomyces longhuiensis]UDM00051.1 hypothetical protein LGI35_18080 [Streptomyces longhuiensis]
MTHRIPLDELTSDQLDALYAHAERAEAALVRVHHVAAAIHSGAPWAASRYETAARIRAATGPDSAATEAIEPAHTASTLRARLRAAIEPMLLEYPEHNRTDEHEELLAEIITGVLGVVIPHGRFMRAMHQSAEEDVERLTRERDGAYRERTSHTALLAALTPGAIVAPATDIDEPGWQIAYLNIGGHQASWHVSPRDADLVAGIEHVPADDPRARWDGHTTTAKYAWMQAYTAELLRRCGPECAEMHTETGRCEIARNR